MVPEIEPTALQTQPNAVLIDVREPHEYQAGHISGVKLVPLATVEVEAETWDKTASYVIVCRSGARSGRAAAYLIASGFAHVYNMKGGMLAYEASGLPVER